MPPRPEAPASSSEPQHLGTAAEQLARLYRVSVDVGMAETTRALLKQLLLEELGAAAPQAGGQATAATPQAGGQATAATPQAGGQATAATPLAPGATAGVAGPRRGVGQSAEPRHATNAGPRHAANAGPRHAANAEPWHVANAEPWHAANAEPARVAVGNAGPGGAAGADAEQGRAARANAEQESAYAAHPDAESAYAAHPDAESAYAAHPNAESADAAHPNVESADAAHPNAESADAAHAQAESVAHLELRLRQLIDIDAPWAQLETVALTLYERYRSAGYAARVVELALLQAPDMVLVQLLRRFKTEQPDFYQALHPTVRVHLVVRLWQQGLGEVLGSLLFRLRDSEHLQPLERLFIFMSMADAKDPTQPYMYGRRFQADLMLAASESGAHVGVSLDLLRLHLGRQALDLGYHQDAVHVLEQINQASPERDEALRLLLQTSLERNKLGQSPLIEQLLSTGSPAERLALLAKFLEGTRSLGGFRDRNRPALNDLLADPLSWLPQEAPLWAALSELLAGSRDLEPLLPQLLQVFRSNAAKFHQSDLDSALWQGPLQLRPQQPAAVYWRAVALLHHYVSTGIAAEAQLWEAQRGVLKAQREASSPLPYRWPELHKAAFAWTAKTPHLLEAERTRMLRQLRAANQPEQVTAADLEDYVAHEGTAPALVLLELEALAEAKGAPALAGRFLLKRAQQTHLTNRDVDRLWHLANSRGDTDLAWRCATVLHSRHALAAVVRHPWEISGEKRSTYAFLAPRREVVESCLVGLPQAGARLCFASVQVGSVLPELLAMLDPAAAVVRSVAPAAGSQEAVVDKALSALDWLPSAKRRYRFSFEAAMGGAQLPAFMQVLPANQWSLLVQRLAERLGVQAWGWRLSRLHSQIVDLIPRLASRQDLRRHSGRVATWLKELRPEQRAAWQDLATLSRALGDEEAGLVLAAFICRLATVMLQNHAMALTSLQTMRAPIWLLWNLETWLLSEDYSRLRRDAGSNTRLLVPQALQRLQSIVETAG